MQANVVFFFLNTYKPDTLPIYSTSLLRGSVEQFLRKNDDSVKEAPAYCRSFLDGLTKLMGAGKGRNPLLMFYHILKRFVKFCNFGVDRLTDRQTDRPTDRPK